MRNNMDTFNRYYSKTYILTHPWKWFVFMWRAHRDAHERCKYGWCKSDTWDMYYWMFNTLTPMLKYLKENANSYPADLNSLEEWQNILGEIIQHLENANEDSTAAQEKNQYEKEYNSLLDASNEEREPIAKLWCDREKQIEEFRVVEVKKAMEMIGKYFFNLWN